MLKTQKSTFVLSAVTPLPSIHCRDMAELLARNRSSALLFRPHGLIFIRALEPCLGDFVAVAIDVLDVRPWIALGLVTDSQPVWIGRGHFRIM